MRASAMCRLVVVLLAVLIGVAPARATELTVFAAASLTDAMKAIGAAYEKQTGVRVACNFGASSLLARQIQEGAPADIFFSADEAKMNQLAARRLILADTRRSLLANTLVVVVPADAPRTFRSIADLAAPSYRAIAIADPLTVPAGIYAKQYLRSARVWSRVVGRLIPTDNVRATLSAVEWGNVDAGIVYKTDALISKKVAVAFEVPRADGPRITYSVAVLVGGAHTAAARAFVQYLAGTEASAVFRRFGFLVETTR